MQIQITEIKMKTKPPETIWNLFTCNLTCSLKLIYIIFYPIFTVIKIYYVVQLAP